MIMKKTSKLLIIFLIFSIYIGSLSQSVKGYAADNETNVINDLTGEENEKIQKFIENNMDKGKIPGLSVVIVKGDKTVYQQGFGYADLENKKRVTSKSIFEIGSNSKAFTALGILNLQKDGKLKLEDEVSKYIPWLKVKYEDKEVGVTIEQLLHHTSGVPYNTIDKIPSSNEDNALEETVRTLQGIKLDSRPGEKYQYATINYDVLGLVIEKVTGKSYEKYIEEAVVKPMNLNNTYMDRGQNTDAYMTKGYKLAFFKPSLYDAPMYRGNKPAGYILSNAEDMAKWLMIQMGTSKDSNFSKDLIKISQEPNRRTSPLDNGSSYAGGWFVFQNGGGEISHGGTNPNYSSFIVFRPEEKIGVAVLSNTNSEYVTKIGQGINEILQGKVDNTNVKDVNKTTDTIAVFITVFAGLIVISTLYFLIKALIQIFKKERKLEIKSLKSILAFVISLAFIAGLSYAIYLIPYILFNGLSWNFVFVWLPKSIKIALYFAYSAIWLVYIYSVLVSSFKMAEDKSMLMLVLLSIISGFGNAMIIFTINMGINSGNSMKIKLLAYFAIGIVLYVYGQKLVRGRLIEYTNKVVYSKRMEIINRLLKTPFNKFEEIEKGQVESTLNNDTETISRFANILINGVTATITLICCFVYLGSISFVTLLFSLLIILFITSIYFIAGRFANRIGEESRDLQNVFFKFINDLIGGFKELSLNEKRKKEFEKDMGESCEKYKGKQMQSANAFANMFVVGELLFTLSIGAIALILPLFLKSLDNISVASYVFILLYMTGPVHGLLDTIPNAIEVRISLKRINKLIEQITTAANEDNKVLPLSENKKISLKLNDVEYIYDKEDERSFKVGPISCEFNSGEIIFITGGNGSGKSTLAKLITGLYPIHKGRITINNNDTKEKDLNERYSTVFSDFYLFDKLYGIDYENKGKEIERYLKLLQLDSKVKIQDGKFNTTKLSTGQKKRLALLVTYLEDRPIYLFDEWAADQDPEFRLFFYDTILPDLKKKGKCVIAITHDDHYFKLADKVIKMEMGMIS